MATSFLQTTRSLSRDNVTRRYLWLGCCAVLLSLWLFWFLGSHVTVYALSQQGQIQLNLQAFSLSSSVSGPVSQVAVQLNDAVNKNDVIVVLEHQQLDADIRNHEKIYGHLVEEVAAAQDEKKALEARHHKNIQQLNLQISQLQQQLADARNVVALQQKITDRYKLLASTGHGSELDLLQSEKVLVGARQSISDFEATIAQHEVQREQEIATNMQQLSRLSSNIASFQSKAAQAKTSIDNLRLEREKYSVRAPADGVIGDLLPMQVGDQLASGATFATLLPPSELKVVAQYLPAQALGRIKVGQSAKVNLVGFPWTQYGSWRASVTNVAQELRDNLIRVELRLEPNEGAQVELAHGMPVVVEVATERLSPWALMLKSAGVWLGRDNPQATQSVISHQAAAKP